MSNELVTNGLRHDIIEMMLLREAYCQHAEITQEELTYVPFLTKEEAASYSERIMQESTGDDFWNWLYENGGRDFYYRDYDPADPPFKVMMLTLFYYNREKAQHAIDYAKYGIRLPKQVSYSSIMEDVVIATYDAMLEYATQEVWLDWQEEILNMDSEDIEEYLNEMAMSQIDTDMPGIEHMVSDWVRGSLIKLRLTTDEWQHWDDPDSACAVCVGAQTDLFLTEEQRFESVLNK